MGQSLVVYPYGAYGRGVQAAPQPGSMTIEDKDMESLEEEIDEGGSAAVCWLPTRRRS